MSKQQDKAASYLLIAILFLFAMLFVLINSNERELKELRDHRTRTHE